MKIYLSTAFILFTLIALAQTPTGISTSSTIISGGVSRAYTIYVPAMYSANTAVPLVFNIHGFSGNDVQQEQYGDFRMIADTANFIVVQPKALGTIPSWEVFGDSTSGAADKTFLMNLLDSIESAYNIDPTRVYSTGYSEGGFMSQDLACQFSTHFAAIASVCGGMVQSHYNMCNPKHPTPFMEIHGTTDPIITYIGIGGAQTCLPTDSVVKYWVNFNNCNSPATLTNLPDINITDLCTVEHYVYTSGNLDGTVELYKVINGGHQWPSELLTGGLIGVGNRNMDFNASAEIWRFFSQHRLVTGIENYEIKNNDFVIYPNPSNGKFKINVNSNQNISIMIYNALGAMVLKESISSSRTDVNLENQPSGIYFYQATEKNNVIKSGKLIIE
jgi:polyhydroxybutyrate depolymerase